MTTRTHARQKKKCLFSFYGCGLLFYFTFSSLSLFYFYFYLYFFFVWLCISFFTSFSSRAICLSLLLFGIIFVRIYIYGERSFPRKLSSFSSSSLSKTISIEENNNKKEKTLAEIEKLNDAKWQNFQPIAFMVMLTCLLINRIYYNNHPFF